MLPPVLKKIKSQLADRQQRGYPQLSGEERELLLELEFLDADAKIQQTFRENQNIITKIVSGPSDRCPCCGR